MHKSHHAADALLASVPQNAPPRPRHTLLELHGCTIALLNAPPALKSLILEAVRLAHGTIVTEVFHTFSRNHLHTGLAATNIEARELTRG